MRWNDYFMGMAHAAAAKSKDPSTQNDAFNFEVTEKQ